jgi:hypothetical protein
MKPLHKSVGEAPTKTTGPVKAVRKHCLDCCNGSANEVSLCGASGSISGDRVRKGCPLWLFRFGHAPSADEVAKVANVPVHPEEYHACSPASSLSAIRLRCLDCVGGDPGEVAACTLISCDLWEFRLRTAPATSITTNQTEYETCHST